LRAYRVFHCKHNAHYPYKRYYFFLLHSSFCFVSVHTDPGKPRVIYSWIENKPDKTYYSLAINGHTIYRINYPEKLFKWYHVCQSWNGHTGEWQLWINSERVGRGFYNLVCYNMGVGRYRCLYIKRSSNGCGGNKKKKTDEKKLHSRRS